MVKRAALFKQADLQRALRAMRAAGLVVARIEIDAPIGKIGIITNAETGQQTQAPLDKWMASHARSA
jgi:hypothetical protein